MKILHITLPALALAAFLAAGVVVPGTAHAAYTFRNQTFETQAEYTVFVAEYMRIWRTLQAGNTGASETPVREDPVSSNGTSGASGADTITATNGASGADGSNGANGAQNGATSGASHTDQDVSASTISSQVTTSLARDVADDNAWVTGSFDIPRGRYATTWFEYGFSPNYMTKISAYQILRSYGGDTDFDQRIRGLNPQTKYWYRAAIKTADGRVRYGEARSLTTSIDYDSTESLVAVSTDRIYDIDESKATFKSRVKLNDSTFATVWFLYGTASDDLTQVSRSVRVVPGANRFTATYAELMVGKLEPNTVYYVRAVAQDDMGVYAYGDVRSFTTRRDIENEQPKITLQRIKDVTAYSATFSTLIDMNDGSDGIVFLVYGEDSDDIRRISSSYKRFSAIRERGDDLQKVLVDVDLDTFDSYDVTVRDLEPYTRYYYSFGIEYDNEFGDRVMLLTNPTSFGTKRQ